MAFNRANLQRLSPTSTGLWAYAASGDSAATIKAADYFLGATTELVIGDVIIVQSATTQVLGVATNTGSALTTAYLTNA